MPGTVVGASGEKFRPLASGSVAAGEQHGALERRQRLAREQFGVARAEEFADREQQASAAASQDEGGLLALEPRVERHEHAPLEAMPSAATIHSAELGAQIATRSPWRMPEPVNAAAAARAATASSRNVRRVSSVTIAGASP